MQGNTALHIAHKKSSSSVITVLTRVDDGRIELKNEQGELVYMYLLTQWAAIRGPLEAWSIGSVLSVSFIL